MKTKLIVAGAVTLLLVIIVALTFRKPSHRPAVKILLDWKAEPTYAGFYIAKQKGFFSQIEKDGTSIEIIEGSGATLSAQLMGNGDEYLISACSGEATAIAVSKGIPIKSVAVLYPAVPTVIYSRADTAIRTPQDMNGKRIGLIDGSITLDEYRGLIAVNNLDRSKINEVHVGWDVAPLLTRQVDGLMNYAELTPVELRLKGHDIVTMRLADFGVTAYSLNLIVNADALKENEPLVKKLVEGICQGYEFLKTNPSEAAALFGRAFPEKDKAYLEKSTEIVAQQLGQGRVGEQTQAGWQATIKTLQSLGLLQREITVEEVAAPNFLK